MSTSGYRTLFRLPAVRWQAASGLLAQVIQGASGVGIVLVIHQHGRPLALAGAVLAAFWIAGAVARPIQGRLIDRRGPAGLMALCGVVNGACVIGIVGLSSSAPGWVLIVVAVVGGLGLPPVSTCMRIAWAGVVEPRERTAAYSLVYLVQELSILTGPLVLAALVAASSASVGLITVAAIATVGTLAFAVLVRGAAAPRPERSEAGSRPVPRIRNMQLLLLVAMLVGVAVGAVQVAVPTFATERGSAAAAGVLIAVVSIGGIFGAAAYAGGRWRWHPATRLVALLGSLTVVLAMTTAAHTLVVLGVFLCIAGLPLNPVFATLSLLVDQHVPSRGAGEAFGWLSTGIAGGTGGGSVVAATLVAHQHDARAGFIVAAVAGAAATAVALAALRSLRGARPRWDVDRRPDRPK